MADHYGANFGRGRQSVRQYVDGGDYGGRVRVLYDEYTTTGAEAVGDRILVGRLRVGERYLDGFVQHGALGASTTLKLGDKDDDDRFLAATATASAGVADARAAAGVGHRPIASADVFLTVGGASLAAGQTLKTVLRVVRD